MTNNVNMLPKCTFVSTDGTPCRAPRMKNSVFCRWHDPKGPAKTNRNGEYESRLREIMAELAASPNSVAALIAATLKHINIAIEMGCEHYSKNPKEVAGFLKLMETRLKLIKLQQQITDTGKHGPEYVKKHVMAIATVIKRHCSEDQVQKIRDDLIMMLKGDPAKDAYDIGLNGE